MSLHKIKVDDIVYYTGPKDGRFKYNIEYSVIRTRISLAEGISRLCVKCAASSYATWSWESDFTPILTEEILVSLLKVQ